MEDEYEDRDPTDWSELPAAFADEVIPHPDSFYAPVLPSIREYADRFGVTEIPDEVRRALGLSD